MYCCQTCQPVVKNGQLNVAVGSVFGKPPRFSEPLVGFVDNKKYTDLSVCRKYEGVVLI